MILETLYKSTKDKICSKDDFHYQLYYGNNHYELIVSLVKQEEIYITKCEYKLYSKLYDDLTLGINGDKYYYVSNKVITIFTIIERGYKQYDILDVNGSLMFKYNNNKIIPMLGGTRVKKTMNIFKFVYDDYYNKYCDLIKQIREDNYQPHEIYDEAFETMQKIKGEINKIDNVL